MSKAEQRGYKSPLQNRKVDSHPMRSWALVIVAVVLGILVAYQFLTGSREKQTSSKVPKIGSQVEEGKGTVGQRAGGEDATARSLTGETQTRATGTVGVKETTKNIVRSTEPSRSTHRESRRAPSAPNYKRVQELMAILKEMKPRHGKWSPEEINEVSRLIKELVALGSAGFPAIREYLESGQDVSFAEFGGKTPPEYASLRLALIDALAQMGDSETAAYMAGMLQTTTNPAEIALLVKGLERSSPGVYRPEINNVVRSMLDQALKGTRAQYPGVGHLFGIIQEYGDESLAVDLENIYRKSSLEWGEFALMALTKMPQGSGIPTLLKLVDEMSGNPGAYGTQYNIAMRMLAQASREYPQANDALLKLVRADKINTAGLIQVASALGGAEHRVITDFSYVSLRSRGETDLNYGAPQTWTDAQIDQRLSLIDQLLRTNPQPAAVKALEDARKRLLVWRERPMVGGVRMR